MSDLELLQLATKAAGYDYRPGRITIDGIPMNWNPLVDDSDALRLAVKLNLLIDCCGMCARPIDDSFEWLNATGPDEFANVRRAMVLCAAEIGRRMV